MASNGNEGIEAPSPALPREPTLAALPDAEPATDAPAAEAGPAGDFSVVGIGASAGGLEALIALLRHVTNDGTAFVVVQHLAPNQKSMLSELLGRASPLVVTTIQDGMPLQVNVVYVTPPNAELELEAGVFRVLTPAALGHPRMPIDAFFRSLAQHHGARAMGVVLSGTGTDGTLGLVAIKAAGGITYVQEPSTAQFDGMPRNALERGNPDFCLPPEQIAEDILRISKHPYLRRTAPSPHFLDQLGKLAQLLKKSSGIDLSHYKLNTIERRIQRRMAVHKIERITDYVRLCYESAKEFAALTRDLLINVTSFFRDEEPFDVLKTTVLPSILQRKTGLDPVRVWIPGCSSGEEAYSIAICLLELLEAQERQIKMQLFGTDLDEEAIQQARRGVYLPNIAVNVSPERLRKYFVKTDDGHYQISRQVRDMVVFSVHNLSCDPPFSRLDLVSCRNLLIYLQPVIQKKVLRTFHYALNLEGFLMLGTSETVGDCADVFTLVDRKNKIYAAKHATPVEAPFALMESVPAPLHFPKAPLPTGMRTFITLAQLADRNILEQHAPPAVVVSDTLEILYFRGRTERYLQHPSGMATHNILRLVRPELHGQVKQALEKVLSSAEAVTSQAQIKTSGAGFQPLALVAQPLQDPESKARCVLLLFKELSQDRPENVKMVPSPSSPPKRVNKEIQELRQELALTKDYLQSTVEEAQHANEELKAANEELQSSNEELQSTNEELETSKEELQSTNEELVTFNDELQNRMKDLHSAKDDLHNVLLGVDRAVIIVGLDLRIRRFTQAAERLLNLLPSDIGRSVTQLKTFFGEFEVEKVISETITTVSSTEQKLLATNRHWYTFRVLPYRTIDLTIRGAVIMIIDIDVTQRRTELTTAVDEYAAEALAALPQPLLIVNREHTVIWANKVYFQRFQREPQEVIATRFENLGFGEGANPVLVQHVDDSFATGVPFSDLAISCEVRGMGPKNLLISGSRIRHVVQETALVLLSFEGDFRNWSQGRMS